MSDGDSEIRVINGDYFENLTIHSDVTIIGGYNTCDHATSGTPEPTQKSFIHGTAVLGGSVIQVNLNGTSVELRSLYIRDAIAHPSVINGGHGVLVQGASGTVKIIDSTIANNRSTSGGGVYVKEVAETVKYVDIIDSTILANMALGGTEISGYGGGIYCGGTGTKVSVVGESDVSLNLADYGGGIAAEYGCLVFINAGIDVDNSDTKRGIMNNTADINGGGVYIGNNARLFLDPTNTGGQFGVVLGDRDVPATIARNSAGSNGGGVYAEFSSLVMLEDSLIFENSAGADGGGVYVTTDSKINTAPSGYECWKPESCVLFGKNTAAMGGAVYILNTDQTSGFQNTDFYGNRANDATVMHITGLTGLEVFIRASNIYNNGNNGVGSYADFGAFRISTNAIVYFSNTTVVDNDLAEASWVMINSNSTLNLYNSIIHNPENVVLELGSAQTTADCLIVNDDTNISAADVYVEADPGFVDSPGNDYHLRPDSVAVDLCDQAPLGASGMDHDGDPWGIDIQSRANIEGPFDAGADEYNDHESLFFDGFE